VLSGNHTENLYNPCTPKNIGLVAPIIDTEYPSTFRMCTYTNPKAIAGIKCTLSNNDNGNSPFIRRLQFSTKQTHSVTLDQ